MPSSAGDIRSLLVWIKKNLLKERPELFIQGDSAGVPFSPSPRRAWLRERRPEALALLQTPLLQALSPDSLLFALQGRAAAAQLCESLFQFSCYYIGLGFFVLVFSKSPGQEIGKFTKKKNKKPLRSCLLDATNLPKNLAQMTSFSGLNCSPCTGSTEKRCSPRSGSLPLTAWDRQRLPSDGHVLSFVLSSVVATGAEDIETSKCW